MTNPTHMTSFRMLGFIPPPPHTLYNEVPKYENKIILVIFALLGSDALKFCC